MDLPISVAMDYIKHAFEKEKDQAAWELWSGLYPFMATGFIKEIINFDEFKNKIFEKQYQYTQKSLEEIEKEMLEVVAKYEMRE